MKNKVYSLWLTTRNKYYTQNTLWLFIIFFRWNSFLAIFFSIPFVRLCKIGAFYCCLILLAWIVLLYFCSDLGRHVWILLSLWRSTYYNQSIGNCISVFSLYKAQGPDSPTVPVVDTIEAEKSTVLASVSSSDQPKEQ